MAGSQHRWQDHRWQDSIGLNGFWCQWQPERQIHVYVALGVSYSEFWQSSVFLSCVVRKCGFTVAVTNQSNGPRWKICLIVIKSWPQHYFDDTGSSSVSMEYTGQSRQSQKEIYFALSWERHTDHQVHMEYLPLNCQIALKWQTRKGKIKVGNYKPGSFFLIIAKC